MRGPFLQMGIFCNLVCLAFLQYRRPWFNLAISILSFAVQRLGEGALLGNWDVGNCLLASVGYGQVAQEKLQDSHPAFTHVGTALKAAERGYAAVKHFDEEFFRRKREAEKLQSADFL